MLQEEIGTLPTGNESSGVKIKIVDFGIFCSNRGNVSEKSTAGSLKYMAPELLSGRTHSTPKIDVWSMGCMLYSMVTGEYPFNGSERDELKKQILTKIIKVRVKQNQHLSEPCLELIERMLVKEPNDRISMHEIINHPWLMEYKQNKKVTFDWTKVSESSRGSFDGDQNLCRTPYGLEDEDNGGSEIDQN